MSTKYSAHGLKLKMGDGATPTELFTEIAALLDVSGPGLKLDTKEVTTHSSAGKEFVATIIDGGEISAKIVWDPAEATHKNAAGGLSYALLQKLKKNFQIVLTDTGASVVAFAAFVTEFDPVAPVAGELSATIKLRVSGVPVMP